VVEAGPPLLIKTGNVIAHIFQRFLVRLVLLLEKDIHKQSQLVD